MSVMTVATLVQTDSQSDVEQMHRKNQKVASLAGRCNKVMSVTIIDAYVT
jgi:hypothetical protein